MPRKQDSKQFDFPVTEAELAKITADALAAKLSTPNYVRQCLGLELRQHGGFRTGGAEAGNQQAKKASVKKASKRKGESKK